MSSSCRSRAHRRRSSTAAAGVAVVAISLVSCSRRKSCTSCPELKSGAEYNTNRELIPDPALAGCNDPLSRSVRGAIGAAHASAPKSNCGRGSCCRSSPIATALIPSNCSAISTTASTRSEASSLSCAQYSRQDSFNAEYGNANFDPFEPQNPNADDTGITYIGDTRKRITVEPDYSFAVSELTRIGASSALRQCQLLRQRRQAGWHRWSDRIRQRLVPGVSGTIIRTAIRT